MKEFLYLFGLFFGILAFLKLFYVMGVISVLPKTKGALFVPTSRRKIRALLEELPFVPSMRVVDLGCGDGRFLRAIWQRYGVVGEGFEINPGAVALANLLNFLTQTPSRIYRRDFFKVDLSPYDLVFCYLFPDLLKILRPKLERELRPGTLVVSCNFPIPGWSPEKILQVDDPIFIYRKT